MDDTDGPDQVNENASSGDDGEIIDLTDVVSSSSPSEDSSAELAGDDQPVPENGGENSDLVDMAESSLAEDEDIIELTDTVLPPSRSEDDGGEVIDLNGAADDAVEAEPGGDNLIDDILEITLELEDIIDEELEVEPEVDDGFIEDLGLDLDEIPELLGSSPSDPDRDSGSVPESVVSPQQIEEALERVVERVFSEKIEGLLVAIIERTVKTEMEKLKALLGDPDVA